jgi:hypothetical protein
MKTSLKCLGYGLLVACLGFSTSACNTSKATADTMVKFTSSTSPGELFTGDGLVEKSQKLNLYTAIVQENLQQDIARGHGEYLVSLGVLLDVAPDRQQEWGLAAQNRYAIVVPTVRTTPSELLIGLHREVPSPLHASERAGE